MSTSTEPHYAAAATTGGIAGFIMALLAQWWPTICAFLHICAAT